MENVKGFDQATTRNDLLDALRSRDYHWQEFLLSPEQIGMPNSRLRYYLIASRTPFRFTPTKDILDRLPQDVDAAMTKHVHELMFKVSAGDASALADVQEGQIKTATKSHSTQGSAAQPQRHKYVPTPPIAHFLDTGTSR